MLWGQAARTLTAFTVVILTVLCIWYLNPNACAAFFFSWQGLLPMQARAMHAIQHMLAGQGKHATSRVFAAIHIGLHSSWMCTGNVTLGCLP